MKNRPGSTGDLPIDGGVLLWEEWHSGRPRAGPHLTAPSSGLLYLHASGCSFVKLSMSVKCGVAWGKFYVFAPSNVVGTQASWGAECLKFSLLGKCIICTVGDGCTETLGSVFNLYCRHLSSAHFLPSHCRIPCVFCILSPVQTSTHVQRHPPQVAEWVPAADGEQIGGRTVWRTLRESFLGGVPFGCGLTSPSIQLGWTGASLVPFELAFEEKRQAN